MAEDAVRVRPDTGRFNGGPALDRHAPDRRATAGETARHTYAALDLGTNNCRLLVARPQSGGGARNGFVVVDAFSRIVRLGEGLTASGRLSDAAMDRAVAALAVCADKLRRRNVSLSRAVATEACRRAANGRHFVDRVHRETGIALDILPRGVLNVVSTRDVDVATALTIDDRVDEISLTGSAVTGERVRVAGERDVQRGGACLRRAEEQEVRERHGPLFSTRNTELVENTRPEASVRGNSSPTALG